MPSLYSPARYQTTVQLPRTKPNTHSRDSNADDVRNTKAHETDEARSVLRDLAEE